MDRCPCASATIRPATPADAPQLAALRYRFRSELERPGEPELAFLARTTPWIATRLAQPQWRAWVAVADTALVGNLFLQLIEKIPNPVAEAESLAYITNVYVEPAYRGQGLGRALLEAALAACPPTLVDTIVLWPTRASVTLYRRAGFGPPASLLERRSAEAD
ncbi:MAG: GNAT family N-acetyltransferase [Chloroflexi bacterium OHK40]